MKRNTAVLRLLLFFGAMAFGSSEIDADFLGAYRNSTGTALDSVYIPFAREDSLWLNLEDGDSVMIVRYRGRSFVDSTREVWSTNDINRAFTAGTWLRAFRASDGSGNIGQYTAFIGAWKNGAFDGTRAEIKSHTYIVLSDPQYDSATIVTTATNLTNEARVVSTDTLAQVTNEVRIVSTDTIAQLTNEARLVSAETLSVLSNEARVVSTDTLTTILGNVNGSVGSVTGAVGSVTSEVRVVSTDTLTTLLGNVSGSVNSVTSEVRVNSIDSLRYVMAVDTVRVMAAGALDTSQFSATVRNWFDRSTIRGVCSGNGTATTIILPTAADNVNDGIYIGQIAWIYAGTGGGQAGVITDYIAATRTATVSRNWTISPTTSSQMAVIAADQIITSTTIATNAIGAAQIAANAITSSEAPNLDAAVSTRMPRTDTSTIRGNIVSQKITVNANGVIDSVRGSTNPVATTAADKAAARDSNMHFSQFGPILKNPSFELNDSLNRDMNITGWLAGTAGTDSSQTSANAYVGKYSVLLNGRSSTLKSDSMALGAGHRYKFGAWVWWDGTNVPLINFKRGGTQVVPLPIQPIVATLRQWQWVDTTFLVTTAGIHHVEILAGVGGGDSLFVDGIMLDRIPDSLGAAGSTDTNAIRNMMLANGFARVRFKNAAFTNDTVNAATAPVISCAIGTQFLDTIFTYNTTTSSGIPSGVVRIENSSGGVLATVQLNNQGKMGTTFDAGTYYLRPAFLNGIVWTDIVDTFVITGAGKVDTIRGTTFNPGTPATPSQCVVYQNVTDKNGLWAVGAHVVFTLQTDTAKIDSALIGGKIFETWTDTLGAFRLSVFRNSAVTPAGSSYSVSITSAEGEMLLNRSGIVVPNQSTWKLTW